jgi:hypothetical protein
MPHCVRRFGKEHRLSENDAVTQLGTRGCCPSIQALAITLYWTKRSEKSHNKYVAVANTGASLYQELVKRQLAPGGWSYLGSPQISIEATCLGALALAGLDEVRSSRALQCICLHQLRNGGWPAFVPDLEPSWATTLALITLSVLADTSVARDHAVDWALTNKGREGGWFWRYKFQFDRGVRFRPELFGWPWIEGACSWVIPTGLMMVALKQFVYCKPRPKAKDRLRLGARMLLDRCCVGGGWNAGNSIVYGVPLPAHVESTAIALLGLQAEPNHPAIRTGMQWLEKAAESEQGPSSLSWTVLCLAAYGRDFAAVQSRLVQQLSRPHEHLNTATLALTLLAVRCEEMIHPFIVPV